MRANRQAEKMRGAGWRPCSMEGYTREKKTCQRNVCGRSFLTRREVSGRWRRGVTKRRPAAPEVFRLARRAARSVGPTGTSSRGWIGHYLYEYFGGSAKREAGATQVRISQDPTGRKVPPFSVWCIDWLTSLVMDLGSHHCEGFGSYLSGTLGELNSPKAGATQDRRGRIPTEQQLPETRLTVGTNSIALILLPGAAPCKQKVFSFSIFSRKVTTTGVPCRL
jgi:hypothetical protein